MVDTRDSWWDVAELMDINLPSMVKYADRIGKVMPRAKRPNALGTLVEVFAGKFTKDGDLDGEHVLGTYDPKDVPSFLVLLRKLGSVQRLPGDDTMRWEIREGETVLECGFILGFDWEPRPEQS